MRRPIDAEAFLRPEELNEQEAIVGMEASACRAPLNLFDAWQNTMELPNSDADKFVKCGRCRSKRTSGQWQRQFDCTTSSCRIDHSCTCRRGHD